MESILKSLKIMGRMSYNLHILHSHLDEFKDNMGVHSEVKGNSQGFKRPRTVRRKEYETLPLECNTVLKKKEKDENVHF